MTKVHVTAKRDFLESLTSAKPLDGLAEMIGTVLTLTQAVFRYFFSSMIWIELSL